MILAIPAQVILAQVILAQVILAPAILEPAILEPVILEPVIPALILFTMKIITRLGMMVVPLDTWLMMLVAALVISRAASVNTIQVLGVTLFNVGMVVTRLPQVVYVVRW